jgi:hypothetical protein
MKRLVLVMTIAACNAPTFETADKIAKHAGGASRVTKGGGKFVNVEYGPVSQKDCDELQHWTRENIKDPPDCVRVQCHLTDGSDDSIVSHDGMWEGGSGYYPQCAK